MDVLQKNFPQILPTSITQLQYRRKGEATDYAADIYANYNRGAPADSNGYIQACDKKFLREILRDLDRVGNLVLLSRSMTGWIPLDSARLCLQLIDREIERLIMHELIKCDMIQDTFLELVEKKVDQIELLMELCDSLESAYEDYELYCANKSLGLPPGTARRSDGLLWPAWARNLAKRPNAEQLNRASAEGTNVPIREQYLPRGCLTILEHWRKDVNDVVDAILQINDHNDVKEQAAGVKDSYFALDKDKSNGKMIRLMQPLEAIRQDYCEAVPHFRPELICSTANWLEKLVGITHRGRSNFVIMQRTYLDFPGMRAVSKKRARELTEMGHL